MKHLEFFNHWYDRILNSPLFCIDDKYVHTIGIAWIFKDRVDFEAEPKWHFLPRITGDAQYYNALLFVRVGLPMALFLHVRFSRTTFVQVGAGYKQTGRIAIHCRCQTDASSAVGYHAGLDNNGQASGWLYGKH